MRAERDEEIGFKPVRLILENQIEVDMLYKIGLANITVPHVVSDNSPGTKSEDIEYICEELRRELYDFRSHV